MRVLIVKTSSMGDLIHTLPAVTDAARALPGIAFDWVAEESFAEIPAWHPAVARTAPIALRRWRRGWLQAWQSGELAAARAALREAPYDLILDAQGLVKSALVASLARGPRAGLDWASAREPVASCFYQRRIPVPKGQHAIERVRQLFAAALGYPYAPTPPDYGLRREAFASPVDEGRYVVFLHGTSWPTKRLPAEHWAELARHAAADGYAVYLPWGSDAERQTAEAIAAATKARVLPRLSLTRLAGLLARARGVIGVDTGLAHLGAALGTPGLTIYTATFPQLTGARGRNQRCLLLGSAQMPQAMQPDLSLARLESFDAGRVWRLWGGG